MRQNRVKANGAGRRNGRNRPARVSRWKGFWHAVGRAGFFLLFALALALVMTAGERPLEAELGETSARDFKARIAFTSVDVERTRAAREQARLAAPVVFRAARQQWTDSVADLLRGVESGPRAVTWEGLPRDFDRPGVASLVQTLQPRHAELEQALAALSEKSLASKADLDAPIVRERREGAAVLDGASNQQATVALSEFVPVDASDQRFRQALEPVLRGLSQQEADLACRLFAAVLRPNAALDSERSREGSEAASAAEGVRTKSVEQGRLILAKGSEVTRQHIEDLSREREQYWSSGVGRLVKLQRFGGLAVILLIVMAGATIYVVRYRPELLQQRLQTLSFTLCSLALVAMARACVIWGVTPLVVPVPMMVMVMCLVYDQRFGLDVAVFYAMLVRLACPAADAEFFTLLLGGMIAALLSGQVRTRSTLLKAGLFSGAAQFCAVWGMGLMAALDGAHIPLRFWDSALLAQSLAALANGLGSGFVVSGMLPAIETLFGVTTDIRLLEWSDPNQPLLQRLLLDAPGSYHHSMIVGTLAADAAEAVGANPLLARVSAYFHDVGKLKKPDYFAENLPEGGKNPHDDLTPSMSSLIITAHPKDGADMAEQYGVPRPVRDIILQSHGCSVLKYFWDKAQSGANGHGKPDERTFRYRLPKPHSKEAAIVMLCDAVESASRSLRSPSVGQLRNLVGDILRDRLGDGQLDESGLTITDLKRLEDALVHGLTAVFHNRISYPGQEKLERQEPDAGTERVEQESDESSDAGRDMQPADER